jgi:hypothetical protein
MFPRAEENGSPPRQRLDKMRRVGIVTQGLADLPDAEIQALLEVHKGVITPDVLADFGSRQDFSATAGQQFEQPERLG